MYIYLILLLLLFNFIYLRNNGNKKYRWRSVILHGQLQPKNCRSFHKRPFKNF